MPPGDVADNVHDLGHTRPLATLVDDSEIGVEPARDLPGAEDTADIGRYDDQIAACMVIEDVFHQHRLRVQIVGRDVEKALNLARRGDRGSAPGRPRPR